MMYDSSILGDTCAAHHVAKVQTRLEHGYFSSTQHILATTMAYYRYGHFSVQHFPNASLQ